MMQLASLRSCECFNRMPIAEFDADVSMDCPIDDNGRTGIDMSGILLDAEPDFSFLK